jgi:hypothetical protein
MKVGIYTRWQRRDSTYAAIQIAELLTRWQHEVTILTPTPKKSVVSNFWDNQVRYDSQVRFTEWASPLAVVIWMFWPPSVQPEWAGKASKRAILVPDWADMQAVEAIGPLFWRIMAPTRRWARMFADTGVVNVVPCPWSPMLPITLRTHVGPVRVYVPPGDRPIEGDDVLIIDVAEAMIELDRSVEITISIDGHRGTTVKRLERLAKAKPRLTLIRPEDYQRQIIRYTEHSLTLLPSLFESFGISALCSFHMGTPIISLDMPPLEEMASSRNSVLVEHHADRLSLLEAALTLVEGPKLAQLFAGCPVGLERRRNEFESAWASALAATGYR